MNAPPPAPELEPGAAGASITAGAAPLEPEPLPAAAPAAGQADQAELEDAPAEAAARAAAFGDQADQAPEQAGQAPAGAAPASLAPEGLTASSLLVLCDLALYTTVRGICAAKGIPFDAEVQKLARWTAQERRDLEGLAPMAVPYLDRFMRSAPEWTGAAVFGGALLLSGASHVSALADHQRRQAAREAAARASVSPLKTTPGFVAPGIPAVPAE